MKNGGKDNWRTKSMRQQQVAKHNLSDLTAMEAESGGNQVGSPMGFNCPTCGEQLRYFQGWLICPNRDYTSS